MKTTFLSLFTLLTLAAQAQYVASFEQVSLNADSHLDGSAGDTLVSDQGFHFPIIWDDNWSYWAGGWAISNKTDSSRRGTDGLFQAVPEAGHQSANYLIGQQGSEVYIDGNTALAGVYITNTSYAYHSINEGDQFSKKFGGVSGNDPDYFLLHIIAKENGVWKADTVHFYLADFRSSDPTKDSAVSSWTWIDLSKFGTADTLRFLLSSSDTGEFGMNTPGFFALDAISRNWNTSAKAVNAARLSAYPNPASEVLYLTEETNWKIFSIQGKLVMEGSDKSIDIRGMEAGVYILTDNAGRSTRFVKK